MPDADGLVHSRVFHGLRLPVAPLLAGVTAKVLAALAGQESPETGVKSEDSFLYVVSYRRHSCRQSTRHRAGTGGGTIFSGCPGRERGGRPNPCQVNQAKAKRTDKQRINYE